MAWRLKPDALFFCSLRSAIVTPPPSAHDDGFGRGVDGPPLVVNQGHALHPSLHNYTYLSGSHSTAHPVSTARPAARPFLYVAGAGAGQGTDSATTPRALPPAVPVAARQASAVAGAGSGGGGGGPCRPPRHMPRVTATPSTLVPPSLLAPRRSVAGVPAPSAPVAHAVPPGWVPPPPVGGSSAEPIHADDVDDREHMEGGGNWSVHPGPPNYHPRPLAASTPTLPVGSRRSRPSAAAGSQSPPSTRARRTSAPVTSGTPVSGSGVSPATVAVRLSEMSRVHKDAISAIRREMTASRKELAITNGSLRELTKKTDNIAAIVDRLAVSLTMQRRLLDTVGGQLTAAVAAVMAVPAAPTAAAGTAAAPGSGADAPSPVPDGATQPEVRVQDTKWIIDLKVALQEWLLTKFLNSTCAADVWVSTADINIFLRDWTQTRLRVDAKAAVRLLQEEWPLRTRAPKTSAPTADGQPAAATPKGKTTIAYQYLHRSVSHFLQRIGSKAVSAFSSYIHENLPSHKGTLRRLRGTRYKYEVRFSPQDAELLLKDDFFLVDSTCRAGLVRALAAVFDAHGSLRLFSESGPTPGGPRTIACRLGVVALVATKVRAHLKLRAAKGNQGNDDHGSVRDVGGADNASAAGPRAAACSSSADGDMNAGGDGGGGDDGGASGGVGTGSDDVVAVGSLDARGALNGGHRPEWVTELRVVSRIFAAHGASAFNGLRITDGTDPRRADATRPPPPPPPSAAAPPSAATGSTATTVGALAPGTAPSTNPSALTDGGGHTSVRPPLGPSHVGAGAGAWGNLTATHDASMEWRAHEKAAGGGDDGESGSDETWTEADGEEEAPTRRKRTGTEMREATARHRAARSTMGHPV